MCTDTAGSINMHTCINTHYTHTLHMSIPYTHAPHNTHTCEHTTNSTRMHTCTIYTVYTHTHTCSRPLGTLLRNQNASLWCAPSRSTVQLFPSSAFFLDPEPCPGMWSWRGYDPSAPRMESRNSAACFLIPGTGQPFPPSAKGLCFRETKPERAVS